MPFCGTDPMESLESPMLSQYQPVVWKDLAVKAAATAAVAGVAASFLVEPAQVSLLGMQMSSTVGIAAGAAAGSVVADLAHNYVLPLIPHNQKYEKMEHAALSVGASGGGAYLATSLMGNASFLPIFAIGAGSYVAADYIQHNFINKSEGGLLF
jgi:hypothetical protein